MPAKVFNTARAPRSLEHICAAEGKPLPRPRNNLNSVAFLTDGNTASSAWRTATPPTVTANAWKRYVLGALYPVPGRAYVVTSISAHVTASAELALMHVRDVQNPLAGTTGMQSLDTWDNVYTGFISGEGVYTWKFDKPLIVRANERIDFYGLTQTTTGINYQLSYTGSEITDDFDYDLSGTVLVLGDSISGISGESVDVKYAVKSDGSEIGMWPFAIKAKLAGISKPSRIVNIGVIGSNSFQWAWMCDQGRIDSIKAGALIINLGMNNASSDTGLPAAAGTDGAHKTAMKRIVAAYLRKNPGGSVVVNQVTDTDVAARLTAVASGVYAGQTRLAAFRAENAAVVSELAAAGVDIKLARTDLAYTTATAGAYLSTESAGNRTHPSGSIGQPLMAAQIWSALQTTKFVTG